MAGCRSQGFDEGEVLVAGRLLIEVGGFAADGMALAAFEGVAVLVEDLFECG